jgi:hypothetical protein
MDSLELSVLHIGFRPARRVVPISAGTSVDVDVVLNEVTATELERVLIETRRGRHFLDSADVAKSDRYIANVFDLVRKLRPEMLGDGRRLCDAVSHVWINGKRVFWGAGSAAGSGNGPSRGPRKSASAVGAGPIDLEAQSVGAVLASIKPEHLAEMRYLDCWDRSIPRLGGNDALFIVLKPGIGWSWGNGSYAESELIPKRRIRQ